MKIIFLGLLIAILVVYGHGDVGVLNEATNMPTMKLLIKGLESCMQNAIYVMSGNYTNEKEDNERKAKEIELYRNDIDRTNKSLSTIKTHMTHPIFSTEERSLLQRFHDIATELFRNATKWTEKRIEELNEEIRRSREAFEQRNILLAQYANSTRQLIDSYPQYA
ncbi:uncharacterized protein LOC132792650 [Drosophila nasuta]|uniref:Uncharacterized protein LOC117563614 n=1 Tax=Drosophila albomicans TaxID=7291 RepID=A0A6P8W2M4_DROAB|nr:uncharacterized protein LOC117563614 [Drosophila albomicans]XP_060658074.1 uncharacterized protein LOC132792650 [Drosophila nasuta]